MDRGKGNQIFGEGPLKSALEYASMAKIAGGRVLAQDIVGAVDEVKALAVPIPNVIEHIESCEALVKDQASRQKNRYACLPILRQAVEESGALPQECRDARSEYEQRRLLRADVAPEYAQRLMRDQCLALIKSINIKEVTPEASKGVRVTVRDTIDKDYLNRPHMLVRYTGILVSLSHENAMRILSEVTRSSYDDHLSYDVTLDDRLLLHDRFTPGSPGPLGRVAVEAWKRIANIGLSTLILEDLLHGLPFKVPETAKSLALEKVKDPWDIVKSPLLKNAHAIAELWEAGSLDAGDVERMLRSPARLLEKRFESDLPEICAAVARKRIQSQQPARTEPAANNSFSESVVNRERSPWHGNPKWEFFYALHSAVEGSEPFDKAFREKHRNLYEQYKRTEMSLAECIELVKLGEKGESSSRMPTQRPEGRGLRLPSFRPFRRKEEARPAVEESSAPESDLRVSYTIHGMDTEWFQKWLGGLADCEQKAIKKRMTNAAAGNFGDYTRLRGAGKLWEFRFQAGAGQRLYFQFEGKDEIRLLKASSKKEQNHKIGHLRRTL